MPEPITDSRQPLRVGLVGCGAVAEHYHLASLLATPAVSVVACADPRIDRAQRLATLTGGAHACPNHTDLIGTIDLAIVTAPNSCHEPIATDLLEAGVHVLVEKPMARTPAECDRMIAAAVASDRTLAIGHDFRHFPIARFVRSFVTARPLGTIQHIDIHQNAGNRWPSVSPDVLSPAAGGGVMMTFGVHLLDLLCWWFGDLRVLGYRDDAAGGIEADVECEMALPNGASVHFELSRLRAMRDTFIIRCERGTMEVGLHEPSLVRLSLSDGPTLEGHVPDPEFEGAPMRTVFSRQLADVVAAIRDRREPLVTGAAGRRVVALVDSCYTIRRPLRHPWDYPEAYSAISPGAGG